MGKYHKETRNIIIKNVKWIFNKIMWIYIFLIRQILNVQVKGPSKHRMLEDRSPFLIRHFIELRFLMKEHLSSQLYENSNLKYLSSPHLGKLRQSLIDFLINLETA